jgi:hypothetical protein
MKKYKPTIEEDYKSKPCPICGEDTLYGSESCCFLCALQLKAFEEFYDDVLVEVINRIGEGDL